MRLPALIVDHAERAGGDAVAAAVAGGLLDVDRVELGADDRAGRADLQAGASTQCLQTSDIISQRAVDAVRAELLDELDVPPVDVGERDGVVVTEAAERDLPAVRAGSSFHWWQATSHALQPMHTVVSVKNPIGAAGKAPAGVNCEPAAGSLDCAATGVA